MKTSPWVASLLLAVASSSVYAGQVAPIRLPEPGTLELLAISVVIGLVVAIRRRRK